MSDVTIDLDELDWEALEKIEEYVGHPIGKELSDGNPSIKTVRALTLWKLQQTQPDMTMETMPPIRDMSVTFAQLAKGAANRPLAPAPRRRSARSRG